MAEPRVLALALDSARSVQTINLAGRAGRSGVPTLLVVARPVAAPRSRDALEVLDLRGPEQRRPVNRLLLSRPARAARRLVGRPRSRSDVWARRVGSRRYRWVRGFLWWRLFRARTRHLDLASFTHVVVGGADCWAIAWHVVRANPAVQVDASIDVPALVAQLGPPA